MTDIEQAIANEIEARTKVVGSRDGRRALEISNGENMAWIIDQPLDVAKWICTAAHLSHAEYPQYDSDAAFERHVVAVVFVNATVAEGPDTAFQDGDVSVAWASEDGTRDVYSWRRGNWVVVSDTIVEVIAAVTWNSDFQLFLIPDRVTERDITDDYPGTR